MIDLHIIICLIKFGLPPVFVNDLIKAFENVFRQLFSRIYNNNSSWDAISSTTN